MTQIELQQAEGCLSALIDLAIQGEEVVIVKAEQPVVKLVAIQPAKKKRRFGSAKGLIEIADDFTAPLPELQDYM